MNVPLRLKVGVACCACAVLAACSDCNDVGCLDAIEMNLSEPLTESGHYMFTVEDQDSSERATCEMDFDGTNFELCLDEELTFDVIGTEDEGIYKVILIGASWESISVEIERDDAVVISAEGEPEYEKGDPVPDACASCIQGEISIP